MFQRLKNHLKDNHRGDLYIEMLICTTIMLLVSVIIISVASSVNTKLWLDEQLSDIVRQVENSGSTQTEAIAAIEKRITDKLGGYVTYYGAFINNDPEQGLIQLNDTVYVYYHCDKYVAVSIAAFPIDTEINILKAATSNVYYKSEDINVDNFAPSPDDTNKQQYILNTSTKKFHFATCSSAQRISEKNREDRFCTRDELISNGYTACGTCKP